MMKLGKLLTVFLLFFLFCKEVRASHIVGGEWEIVHKTGNQYLFRLILYFDVLNGSSGAFDPQITAAIFESATDNQISFHTLPFISRNRVEYFQPECSTGEVVTDKIVYERIIILSDDIYNNQEGYYVSWQRCCRNYAIRNVLSQDPNLVGTTAAGQTFTLNFPAVVDENGEPFINHSPQLFPPLSDFACPGRPYWIDFAGTDPDGDSLVYDLVTPYSTQFSTAFVNNDPDQPPLPGPYPSVIWRSGYSLNNIVGGSPDLNISDDGFLSVTPGTRQGYFVFAVRVKEYRDGIQIGETRRDFQLFVVDRCPDAFPPEVLGKRRDEIAYNFNEVMNVSFSNLATDETRCVDIQISDQDAILERDAFTENLTVKAIPLNFKGDVSEILPAQVNATLNNGSTFDFQVCFPECPYLDGVPFEVGIVAFDDACALPLSDTLRVQVNLEPPPNQDPYFVQPVVTQQVSQAANGIYQYEIIGKDDDLDELIGAIIPNGFSFEDYGMSFDTLVDQAGEIRVLFNWEYDCVSVDFNERTDFQFFMFIDDLDQCNFERIADFTMNLNMDLPDNTLPDIWATNQTELSEDVIRIESFLPTNILINTLSEDLDNDQIIISAEADNFSLDDFQINFPTEEAFGNPAHEKSFNWNLLCEEINFAEQDSFRFRLMVEDIDLCNITSKDTVFVDLILNKKENQGQSLTFEDRTSFVEFSQEEAVVEVNQAVDILLNAEDPDGDLLDLMLVDIVPFDNSVEQPLFLFDDASGLGQVSSSLRFVPVCNNLSSNSLDTASYRFIFKTSDYICQNEQDSTYEYIVKIVDQLPEPPDKEPPNAFTPNGDDLNDFFALEYIDQEDGLIRTVPSDICSDQFEMVRIFNRWGKEVYQSKDRQFKWYGDGLATGVYYYTAFYTKSKYKGFVHMIK